MFVLLAYSYSVQLALQLLLFIVMTTLQHLLTLQTGALADSDPFPYGLFFMAFSAAMSPLGAFGILAHTICIACIMCAWLRVLHLLPHACLVALMANIGRDATNASALRSEMARLLPALRDGMPTTCIHCTAACARWYP